MAIISPKGNYLRVEDIRVGKNLLQFFAREYSDKSKPPVFDKTFVIPYDINGRNPYVQAYEFLLGGEYNTYRSDLPVVVDEVAPKKSTRTRKAK